MATEYRRESNLDKLDDLFGPPPTHPEDDEPESRIDADTAAESDTPPAESEQPQQPTGAKNRQPGSRRRRTKGMPPPPITRNARRVSARGPVSDLDLVSFNCKMTRGLRRSVKHYAADVEVDIQDVVAAALEDYLAERGIPFPGSDQE